MEKLKSLDLIIEDLRKSMIQLAEEKGDLNHPDVIEISLLLDDYVVKYQKATLKISSHSAQEL